MKRLFVFLLFSVTCSVHLMADDFEKIVQIKLASDQYLWGEARVPDQADAGMLAKDMLLEQIKEWVVNNGSTLDARQILSDCSVLCVKRGSLYLALAYISKEQIGTGAVTETTLVESEPELKEKQFTSEDVSVLLLTTERIGDLKEQISKGSAASVCTWGEIDEQTRPSQLSNAYLVIYNPSSSKIVAVLSPRNPRRTNLFTGNVDSTSNYPGHHACWIIVNE